MIEKLREDIKTQDAYGRKIDEVIDAVNDHASRLGEVEENVYDGPDDDYCDCDHAITVDYARPVSKEQTITVTHTCDCDDPTPDLSCFSTDQLLAIRERANCLLEERLQDDDDDDDCDCLDDDDEPELTTVDTKDGLFSDFAGYVTAHPELRFWQAAASWSGFQHLFGATTDTHIAFSPDTERYTVESRGIDDLFYKTTKGPRK